MGKGFASMSSTISELVPFHLALSSLKWGEPKIVVHLKGAKPCPPWMHDITRRHPKSADIRSSIIATIKGIKFTENTQLGK